MVARHAHGLRKRLEKQTREEGAVEAETVFSEVFTARNDELAHWPWKSIDGLLATVAYGLDGSVVGAGAEAVREDLERRADAAIAAGRAALAPLPYRDRAGELAESPELRNEVLSVAVAELAAAGPDAAVAQLAKGVQVLLDRDRGAAGDGDPNLPEHELVQALSIRRPGLVAGARGNGDR